MYPSDALLHPEVPPLGLRHEVRPRHRLGERLRQDHVAVLVVAIDVLVRVHDAVAAAAGHLGGVTDDGLCKLYPICSAVVLLWRRSLVQTLTSDY